MSCFLWITFSVVRKTLSLATCGGVVLAALIVPARALPAPKPPAFVVKVANGEIAGVPLVEKSEAHKLTRISPMLARAATIAQERAHAHSKSRCWHAVKEALIASGAVASRPKTALAKEAGDELERDFGFKKIAVRDPYAAPIGSVLVYSARRAAGHVELRTKEGFVSDFRSKTPSRRPLLGVYTKS